MITWRGKKKKKKRFRIHNRFVVNSVMIQHSEASKTRLAGVQVKWYLSIHGQNFLCVTPHVGEYFFTDISAGPPRNVDSHSLHQLDPRNDVSCREPVDIFYQPPQPPNGPTAPLSPSYRPGQFLRDAAIAKTKESQIYLRSHCLSARFPEGF